MEMRNYMEDIVRIRMKDILKTMPDICSCEKCFLDMLAYALNNSKPKYCVTNTGEVYAKISQLQGQVDADLVRIITDAVGRISQSPRHD